MFGKRHQTVADIRKADAVGIEHGPAAPHRKAVTVDPDDVDVAWPLRNAFLKNTRTFVDQRKISRSAISFLSMARRLNPSRRDAAMIRVSTSSSGCAVRVPAS